MKLFKYSSNYQNNIKNFEKDIYIYLNLNSNIEDEIIFNYINEFIIYFNKIFNFVKKLKNDINNIEYEYEFEISFDIDRPKILLNKISIIKMDNIKITNICNKIKKNDHINMLKILDENYVIESNTYPYFIINIIKTYDINNKNDFYNEKYLILNNINLNDVIEIDFDNNLVHIFENNNENILKFMESYKFIINSKNIILFEGQILQVEICLISNNIKLNNKIYLIDENSTIKNIIDINNLFN